MNDHNNSHSVTAPGLIPGASFGGDGSAASRLLLEESVSDLGNARVFQALYRGRVAFAPGWGWVFYTGTYWEKEGGEFKALELAGDAVGRRIAALETIGSDEAKMDARRLERWLNKSRLDGVLGMAAGMMRIPLSRFDAEPYLLNLGNGIVNLKSGELLPHNPGHFITMWSPIHYDPNASSELWSDAVAGIACHNEEMAGFLQCLAGYSATGSVSAQWFLYFLGEGANGKSLMTDLWAEILGGFSDTGYAVRVPNETILGGSERPTGAPSPDLLALKGKRLALISEQSDRRPMNTERIKDLTGGDSITARPPHGRQVNFMPTHTLICCGNHFPYVHASDHGFWRRMQVVPFKARFKPSPLGEELRKPEHLSAILTWMVQGAVRLEQGGWKVPAAVIEATEACRRDSDPLTQWVAERCERFDGETRTTTLFDDFDAWRTRRREAVMTQSMFTRRLHKMLRAERQSNEKLTRPSNSCVYLQGLRLRPDAEQP